MSVSKKFEVTEDFLFEFVEAILSSKVEKCRKEIESRFKEVKLSWNLSDACKADIIEICEELMSEFATTAIFEVLHEKKAGDNKTIKI